jgi:hypothetical protein
MNTVSIALPPSSLSTHLRVPSVEVCSASSSGWKMSKRACMRWRKSFDTFVIASKSSTPRR